MSKKNPRILDATRNIKLESMESPRPSSGSTGIDGDEDITFSSGSISSIPVYENNRMPPNLNSIVENLRGRRNKWTPYGNHRVFCKGHVIIGPVRSWWWILILSTVLVTATLIYEYTKYHFLVLILGLILFVTVIISSWLTLCVDPGIIKKPPFEVALQNAKNVVETMKTGIGFPVKVRNIDGQRIKFTYCFYCHVFRPPKSGHCYVCQCCHEQWDHHCPVYGGCVAKRNKYPFHFMTSSITIFYVVMLIASAIAAVKCYNDASEDDRNLLSASLVLDEVILAIILAVPLVPFLSSLPCEKEPQHGLPDNAYNRTLPYTKQPQQIPTVGLGFEYDTQNNNYNDSSITKNYKNHPKLSFTAFNLPRQKYHGNHNEDNV